MRVFLSVALLSFIAGCASTNVKTAAIGNQKNSPITIGYSKQLSATIAKNSNLVFFRLAFSDGSVKVTEIAPYALSPKTSAEEVLVYSQDLKMIGPAYETDKGFQDLSGFVCNGLVESTKKSTYAPCGTGSRFVDVNKTGSTVRNIIAAPLTWGLAVGMNYEIDFENLTMIVNQLQLEALAKRYRQSVDLANKLNGELGAIAKNASTRVPTRIDVINDAGFPPPELPRTIANPSLNFTEKVAQINSFLYEGNPDVFDAIDAKSNAQYESIKNTGMYNVRCLNSLIQTAGFSGTITCPKTVTYLDSKDVLSMSYKLENYSAGTRYPSLSGHDKSLSLKVEGGGIWLTNETNTYIEVKAITVYGGREVMDTKVDLSLAPMASNKSPYSVSEYAGIPIARMFTFNKVKAVDVAGKRNIFGMAIKYRVGNGGNFETLFVKRDVSLSSLI